MHVKLKKLKEPRPGKTALSPEFNSKRCWRQRAAASAHEVLDWEPEGRGISMLYTRNWGPFYLKASALGNWSTIPKPNELAGEQNIISRWIVAID